MGFLRRRVLTALLAANAVKPLRGNLGPLGFAAGWPTTELAPQLIALTALDAAQAVVRGKATRGGLLLAGASVAGLLYSVNGARGAASLAEQQLVDSLGEGYLDTLPNRPTDADLKTPLRDLARPFAVTRPVVEVIRDINYRDGGSRARLDVYKPAGDVSDAPVLIQIHGGGWMIGEKEQQGLLLMNRMAARGWVCVSINYRLAPKHPWPAQIVDVKKAIAWTRENIASYGGDPTYLVATGGSAGGHLSSLAALTPDVKEYQPGFEDADTRIAACVPFYGVYDLAGVTGDPAAIKIRDWFLAPLIFKTDPKSDLTAYELASPLAQVNEDAPDFFVIHGVDDGLVSVEQARAFVEKLREVSGQVTTYLELPGAQHAFEMFSSIRSQSTIRAVERWLEWHRANRREATSDEPATAPRNQDQNASA